MSKRGRGKAANLAGLNKAHASQLTQIRQKPVLNAEFTRLITVEGKSDVEAIELTIEFGKRRGEI